MIQIASKKLTKAERYYKQKGKANKVVRKHIKAKDQIVYGARAVNAYLPSYLDRHTEDWDVYSKTPRASAKRVEKKLDRAFGGNFFEVKKAEHPGTYRVKSNITKREIVDYSKRPTKVPPSKLIGGTRYITLPHSKRMMNNSLSMKGSAFRHDKDRETLQRISIYEKNLKKKKKG